MKRMALAMAAVATLCWAAVLHGGHDAAGRQKLAFVQPTAAGLDAPPQGESRTGHLGAEFMGYDCTKDCSGHRAGFSWAASQGVADLAECTGNSRSFVEGCQAYVNGGRVEDPEGEADDDGEADGATPES